MARVNFRWQGVLAGVLVVAAAATMIGLGFWQLSRLQQRKANTALITARMAQAPVDLNNLPVGALTEFQPVRLRGTYDYANEIILRNRAYMEAPGVHVITPLRLTGRDDAVLVDRGWIPYTHSDPAARTAFQGPAGEVTVSGIVRLSQSPSFALSPADPTPSPGRPRLDAWYWLTLPAVQEQVAYQLWPFFVEAAPVSGRFQPPVSGYDVDLSAGPHLAYAIQWFSFALIVMLGSWALWRQRRRSATPV